MIWRVLLTPLVLASKSFNSKPFTNPAPRDNDDEDGKRAPVRIPKVETAMQKPNINEGDDSDAADSDEEDGEFDSFMAAQPATDRNGITSKQRQKALDKKFTFASGSVKAGRH